MAAATPMDAEAAAVLMAGACVLPPPSFSFLFSAQLANSLTLALSSLLLHSLLLLQLLPACFTHLPRFPLRSLRSSLLSSGL